MRYRLHILFLFLLFIYQVGSAQNVLTADSAAVIGKHTPITNYVFQSTLTNGIICTTYQMTLQTAPFQPGTNDFSMMFWCKRTFLSEPLHWNYDSLQLTNNNFGAFLQFGPSDWPAAYPPPSILAAFGVTDNAYYWITNYANTNLIRASVTNIQADNQWVFLAATFHRSGLMKLYVNNQLVDSSDISRYATTNFTPTWVHFYHDGNPALLSQIRYYQGELTPEQIANVYNGGQGKSVDPVVFASITTNGCYWELNEKSGLSPIGHALTNGVWYTNGLGAILDNSGCPPSLSFTPLVGYVAGGNQFSPQAGTFYGVTLSPTTNGTVTFTFNNGYTAFTSGTMQANWSSVVPFTSTPSIYWRTTTWTLDGNVVAQETNTYTLSNVTANHTLAATFPQSINWCSVIASSDNKGIISPSGTIYSNRLGNVSFRALLLALSGYTQNEQYTNAYSTIWTLDGTVVARGTNVYTIVNITSNHTLSITYQPVTTSNMLSVVFNTTDDDIGASSGAFALTGETDIYAGQPIRMIPNEGQSVTYLGSTAFFHYWNDGSGQWEVGSSDPNGNDGPNGIWHCDTPTGTFSEYSPYWGAITVGIITNTTHAIVTSIGTTQHGEFGGRLQPAGTIYVNNSSNQLFTAYPSAGYMQPIWSVDGVPMVTNTATYTVTNITTNHALVLSWWDVSH